jgi:hypothetical protein
MTIARGEPLLASDILDLTFFPIGMILMMDGSWQDGRGGWYICDGRDTPHGKTPDLKDKFIRGGASAGGTGGSNSGSANITLTDNQLPAHSHPLSGTTLTTSNENQGHTHTVTAAGSISGNGTHNHSINDPKHTHNLYMHPTTARGDNNGKWSDESASWQSHRVSSEATGVTVTPGGGGHEHGFVGSQVTSGGTNVNHTHTVALSGNTGNSAGATSVSVPVSIDTIPEYYTMIYIKKMA